ncbi:MAG: hypothetical protein FRX49_09417 [Trebouxia sp. A1-2]|nr:MAG: hypothetical protein FRX49_09417 [Trebouxia sp. A1-2]
MEGLHRWQPVSRQLPPYLCFKPDKQRLPVLPLADALQAVDHVGKGLRKVWPQLQGTAVGGDGSVLPGCILDAAEVVVRHPETLCLLHGCHLGVGLQCSGHLGILWACKLKLDAHGVACNGFVWAAGFPEGIPQGLTVTLLSSLPPHLPLRSPQVAQVVVHINLATNMSTLTEGICQIGMSLSHVGVQQNASVIEFYALLIVAELVVYGPNEQQYISLVGIDQARPTSQEKKGVEAMTNASSLCIVWSLESAKIARNARRSGVNTKGL